MIIIIFCQGKNTYTTGFEGPWTGNPTVWGNFYFNNLINFKWVLTQSPAGKHQWMIENAPNSVLATFMMLTSDIALLHDPLNSYQELVKLFAKDLSYLDDVFSHAWYKLTTRDMGPVSRCVGPNVPPPQAFQHPLPPPPAASQLPNWSKVRTAVRTVMRTRSPASSPDIVDGQPYYGAMFVHLAFACAATFRRTDYQGGCNGARIRFPPEKDWSVNVGLYSIKQVLQPVKSQFGKGLTWSDLIVFAAQVAIEDASGLSLPFCPGRSDAAYGDGSSFTSPPISLNYSASILQIEEQLQLSGLSWSHTVALQARLRSPVLMNLQGFGYHKNTYTNDPSVLSNQYFRTLVSGWDAGNWTEVTSSQGRREYKLLGQAEPIFMTPSDLNAFYSEDLQPIAIQLASDNNLFLQTFAAAWTSLMSLDRFNGPSGNLCPPYEPPVAICLKKECSDNPEGCVTGTVCSKSAKDGRSYCVDETTVYGKSSNNENCVALLKSGCGTAAGQSCCNPAAICQKGQCILPYSCA